MKTTLEILEEAIERKDGIIFNFQLVNENLKIENKALKEQAEIMEKEINDLRDAWNNEINLNSASENNDIVCPTCGEVF